LTNKEAIECLYNARSGNVPEKVFEEAFNMAIKALERLDDNCVYRIELTDSYRETPREISNLIFSSYDSAGRYRIENGLQNGWWSIEKIKPL
jgi:hypothetical protein